MKSTTSPFARLAHMALIEAEAEYEIELLNPWADPEQLVALNPSKRVPCLQLDDGTVLTEAMVIAMYAADIAPEGSHLKSNTSHDYEICGLAFGVIEAAVYMMTGRKLFSDDLGVDEFDRTHPVAQRRRDAMIVGLGRIEALVDRLSENRLGLAELLVVDAVQYMDFRFPDSDWRPEIPRLDAWIERAHEHRSVSETIPS
ncbi:glutathione S-transferase N-terminal domain-containing protein [Palleronia pelagia]|nr:glutathione S-transferase family protein [Palleronia pelagia]